MKEFYRYIRITYVSVQKAIKAKMSYRWSFFINCVSQALDYAVTFLLMWIMVSAFKEMNGWNAYEVMLLYAFSLLSYGIAGTFFYRIMHNLPRQIRQGTLDDILVKPVKLLPYLISSNFMCNYIAHLTLSVVIMVICFNALEIAMTTVLLFRLIRILLMGAILYSALFLFAGGAAFLIIKNDSFSEILFFFREISFYPISIFPRLIQIIVTVAIPYGFINYYPLREIFEKSEPVFLENAAGWTPVVSILFFVLSCIFFSRCSRHYNSSGS